MNEDLDKLRKLARHNRKAEDDSPEEAAERINDYRSEADNRPSLTVTGEMVVKAEQGDAGDREVLKDLHGIYTAGL